MAQSRIAIIGTGLIGTSLGLALHARPERNYEIVGVDRDRGAAREAKKMGALDREVGSLEEVLKGAGLVVISVPVLAAKRILQEMAPYLDPGAIITDTCSTKHDILRWATEFLPETVHFVGGHPMAGREQTGPKAAVPDLFRGAAWAVTPSPRANEAAVETILGLVEAVGAIPLYIDPAEHDNYAAAVSHVPLLLSVALFRMARDSQGWEDASLLAGPGFRDLTRLASGDPAMSRDIMATNRESVLHWLGRFQDELDTIRQAIESGGDVLTDLFTSTQLDRDAFILNPPQRRIPEGVAPPSTQDQIGRMFVGGLYDKMKAAGSPPPRTRGDDAALRRRLGIPDDDDR